MRGGLSLIVVVGLAFGLPAQQPESSRLFDETGHTVSDPFLEFFDTHGGLEIFGYPITDEFVDPQTGLRVQYFQRARFERPRDNLDSSQIQLGPLGAQYLEKSQSPLPTAPVPQSNSPDCRYFPETGHNVCYVFLEYYDAKGGLEIFGDPLTEFETEKNGRVVQYFQRARMEWRPGRPVGQRVELALLGDLYYRLAGLDLTRLPATIEGAITSLSVYASVETPITGQAGSQTVYVYVTNQYGEALAGADIRVATNPPQRNPPLPSRTNDKGRAEVKFDFGPETPGTIVLLGVTAEYNRGVITDTTRTSFLVWW